MASNLGQQHKQIVSGLLQDSATPGAAVALVLDGELIITGAVGSRDLARSTPLDADACFYIYSITKTLIAAAVLQAVEQGLVTLDDPIREYLPSLPLQPAATVRQLLNHTGGIPDYGGMPEYHAAVRAQPGQPWSAGEFLERTRARGLLFEPGQGWAYSNIGYLMLRMLLEQVHGASLRAILGRQIFAPLGLQRTFVAETLADAGVLTPGLSALFQPDDTLVDIATIYHPGWVSHGVVISTAAELARLLDALFSGRLLSPESLAAMLEPVPVPAQHPLFRQPAYGLGLMIDLDPRYALKAGHGGGGPGYSAGAMHLSEANGRRVMSVALANRDQADLGLRIAVTLAEAALPPTDFAGESDPEEDP